MDNQDLTIKGVSGGVLATLPVSPWYAQLDRLITRVQVQERFFKGGRIAVDLGETHWTQANLNQLSRSLADEGVQLWAVLAANEDTLQAARGLGLQIGLEPEAAAVEANLRDDETGSPAVPTAWLKPEELADSKSEIEGNLVLLGDLSASVSLTVSGNALIWGVIRGGLQAGTNGDSTAFITCLGCEAAEVVLGETKIAVPKKLRGNQPLMIALRDGEGSVERRASKRFKLL